MSFENHLYWSVNYVRREVTVVLRDGTKHQRPLSDLDLPENRQIEATIFDHENWWIHTLTTRGDWIINLGYNAETGDAAPSVPTVYLDQNKWRLVAEALIAPQRPIDEERVAALELARLAFDGQVVLPISIGHLLETYGLYGDRRYEVGVTIARLTHGWQMRNPIDVWQYEAVAALSLHTGRELPPSWAGRSIITTQPGAWDGHPDFGLGRPLPPTIATLMQMLRDSAVLVDLLLDPEHLRTKKPEFWAAHHTGISKQIAKVPGGKEQRRRTARRRYWNENIGYYRAASKLLGLNEVPLVSDKDLPGLLSSTPMVRYLSELFVVRFLNPQSRWVPNDLIDLLHLACAAGHCDFVVGEARTVSDLSQIQRSYGDEITVFRSLAEAVSALG